jgi:hypothetical protein
LLTLLLECIHYTHWRWPFKGWNMLEWLTVLIKWWHAFVGVCLIKSSFFWHETDNINVKFTTNITWGCPFQTELKNNFLLQFIIKHSVWQKIMNWGQIFNVIFYYIYEFLWQCQYTALRSVKWYGWTGEGRSKKTNQCLTLCMPTI